MIDETIHFCISLPYALLLGRVGTKVEIAGTIFG